MSQEDCIFCKIVKGEIPCAKVYESENILAFLDIAPVNRGHALVVAKAHHPTIWDLPPELGPELLSALDKVGKAVMAEVGGRGLNVMMNNLEPAGQLVPHAHFHLIPRFADDGLELWPQHSYKDAEEMSALADAIGKRME